MFGIRGTSGVGVDDMCSLVSLTQETLLENTELRFKSNIIYTFTGSILVSVNPYQPLPIYRHEDVQKYIGQQLGANPPHLFAIAEDSYANLRMHGRDQSILISGESGSGKTEATKLIMQYLAAMTRKKEAQQEAVELMILESSPILEAFGNAKTVRNNNSSRFGKFLEVCFDTNGQICGAKIVQYLLEKSRLVYQANDERNYHVFYALVFGASDEEKAKYRLLPAEQYHYLNQSGCTRINGVNEKEELARLKTAFHYLGIDKQLQSKIFGILAAILLLGNVVFVDVHSANNVEARVDNPQLLATISSLLEMRPDLLANALIKRKMTVKGQGDLLIPLKGAEAAENRDAMAKGLYGRLFTWLVNTINNKIQPKEKNGDIRSIGILDIFGFENFKCNSFEQFCINYANEKLQGHFNQHIFSIEQQEYDKEGINWSKIEFKDNQDVLDLIEKRPVGMLSLLDEECRFPRATDHTFLQKLHANHEKNSLYIKSRLGDSKQFGVNHYSGAVSYEISGFLDKNRDTLQLLLLELCQSSKQELLTQMFSEEKEENGSAIKMTVGAQFKDQLTTLMKNLSLTMPHYVRCVKPNNDKAPEKFDTELVLAQLRYSGMLETIRIRKLGYPVRFVFSDFLKRFRCVAPKVPSTEDEREMSRRIASHCATILECPDQYQLGHSKVFLRDFMYMKLETARTFALSIMATKCKKTWKMYRVRRHYVATKQAALFAQTFTLRVIARRAYEKEVAAATVFQNAVRSMECRKEFLTLRSAAVNIQGAMHAVLAQNRFADLHTAAILVQTLLRTRLAIRTLNELIKERERKRNPPPPLPPPVVLAAFPPAPPSTPSPRIVSFREPPPATPPHSHREPGEVGDRAGAPPSPPSTRVSRKRVSTSPRETPREKRERKEREEKEKREREKEKEREQRLALTERLSLPMGLSSVPLPPKKPESPFTPMRNPSPPKPFSKVFSTTASHALSPPPSPSSRSTIFATPPQKKSPTSGPIPPPIFVHFPHCQHTPATLEGTLTVTPSPPGTPEGKGEGKKEEAKGGRGGAVGGGEAGKYPLSKYALHLQPAVKGGSTSPSSIFTYTNKASTQPMHKIPYGPLFKTALKLSNSIMGYMGDQMVSITFPELVKYIVGMGVDVPDLRDEIYCLIVKQMCGNLTQASCMRGWELMAFCTGCFPPSDHFLPYLNAYLSKCAGPKSSQRERKFAGFCQRRLAKVTRVGPRTRPPSESEMEAVKVQRRVVITVYLPTGRAISLRVESTSSAQAMCKRLCKRLHLDPAAKWAFYESYNDLERKLQPKEFLLDIVFKWEMYIQMMDGEDRDACRLIFKRVLVGDRPECPARPDSRFVYNQAIAEVMSGHQPVTEVEAVHLAALSFEHDLRAGLAAPTDWAKSYIPKDLVPYRKPQDWMDIITNELEKIRSEVDKKANALHLEAMYMDYVSSLPLHGSSMFYVALKNSHDYLPTSFYVAVNINGVHFMSTEKILHTIPILLIVSTTFESNVLVVVALKKEGSKKKETFRLVTYQGDDVRAAIDTVIAIKKKTKTKTKKKL